MTNMMIKWSNEDGKQYTGQTGIRKKENFQKLRLMVINPFVYDISNSTRRFSSVV